MPPSLSHKMEFDSEKAENICISTRLNILVWSSEKEQDMSHSTDRG